MRNRLVEFLTFAAVLQLARSFSIQHPNLNHKGLKAASDADAATSKNMFQKYNKPIVLLGTSSDQKELQALGNSLAAKLKGSVVDPSADLVGKFRDIMVLDFAVQDYVEVAKSLYEDQGALSI